MIYLEISLLDIHAKSTKILTCKDTCTSCLFNVIDYNQDLETT